MLPIEPRVLAAVAVVFFLAFVLAPPADAQPAAPAAPAADDPAPPTLAAELGRINATLERIARLLESQVENQQLELTMARIDLGSRRVQAAETELRAARDRREGLENEYNGLQEHLRMIAGELETGDPERLEEERANLALMVDQSERQLVRVGQRMQGVQNEILELENRLARQRSDLEALETWVDRRLQGGAR